MLVLSRKSGDEIVISNGDIRISVLGVTGNRVRLGISAPPGIPVHRMEIHRRVLQAANSGTETEEDAASGQ